MNFEIERWHHLITTALSEKNIQSTEVVGQSLALRDKVKVQIMQQVFSFSKVKAAELFIQHHQLLLVKLLDKVHACQEEDKGCAEVSFHLRYILEFIESYFSKYFNLDEKVPRYYLEISCNEICSQLEPCRKILIAKGAGEGALLHIIFEAFEEFCKSGGEGYTYRRLIYLKELIAELNSLGSMHKEGCIYAALTELLIYMNFNAPAFFNFVLGIIESDVAAAEGRELKLEKLARHRKEITQMQAKPGAALLEYAPPVQTKLTEAIDKEIDYVNARNGNVQEDIPHYGKANVYVPFKGAEIYLLHKAFIDAGGAPGEIYKTLLERTAPVISNKTQKGFSAESLCKYSDKVTPEVKDDVKRFLQKMIRNVESYD